MQEKKQEPQYGCGFKKFGKQVLCSHFGKRNNSSARAETDKCPKSTASCRPISLTTIMGKSMERIINTRINWLLETNNIVANEQAGFRIHRLTNEHVIKFSQFIKDALGNKRKLTAVFIYFKSAYDSVWKENLLLKLVRSGIRSILLRWIELFISNRTCKVRYGEYY